MSIVPKVLSYEYRGDKNMLLIECKNFFTPPFENYTSIICSLQSMQAILTVRVALTDIPQQGHIYFRVLDGLRGGAANVPL